MLKKLKRVLLLISILFLILGSNLSLRAEREGCVDLGCLGSASCDRGVEEFNGCAKDNPCIGGGSIKCEKNYPI